MATWRGITYEEDVNSPIEQYSEGDARITRTLRCAWEDRHSLAKELLGYVHGTLLYPPHSYDGGDGTLSGIYARECTIRPTLTKGTIADETAYRDQIAELTVVYRASTVIYPGTGPIDIGPGTDTVIVEESLEPSVEFLTLPTKDIYIGGTPVEDTGIATPAKAIQMVDWVYTMYHRWFLPSTFFTMTGKVNSAAVASRTLYDATGAPYVFGAETLLCNPPSARREHYSSGVSLWTVTFRFTYRQDGWNKFPYWNTTTNALTWDNLKDGDGHAIPIYETGSFSGVII